MDRVHDEAAMRLVLQQWVAEDARMLAPAGRWTIELLDRRSVLAWTPPTGQVGPGGGDIPVVGGSCEPRCMTGTTVDVIDAVERACLAAADKVMRAGGFVPQPQVHMLIDRWQQPYVGYVLTRPYRQGLDAIKAITRMADAPAAVRATRVVLAWEHADLRTSLHGPGDYPNGMAIVVASLGGQHSLSWHPVLLQAGPPGESELPSVRPDWGIPVTVDGATLPPVMAAVLNTWRTLEGDARAVLTDLIAEGYPVQAARRRRL